MNSIIDRIACDLSLDRIYIKSIIQRSAFYYKRFTIPKQNGDQRVIYQASPELKSLQYWVREKILKLLPISEAAFAYQTGSIIKYSTYCDGDVISAIHHGSQKSIVEV